MKVFSPIVMLPITNAPAPILTFPAIVEVPGTRAPSPITNFGIVELIGAAVEMDPRNAQAFREPNQD